MRKIRVAFINQPFEYIVPPHIGGSIALWTEEVMRAMPENELEFIVYLQRFPNQPHTEWHDGILYRRIPVRPDEWTIKPRRALDKALGFPNPTKAYFSSQLHYLGYIIQVAKDIRSLNVDIVHIHNFSQFVPIVRTYNPRSKIILHMNCEWLSQLDFRTVLKRIQEADKIFSCSNYIAGKIICRFPALGNQIATIYNGAKETFNNSYSKICNLTSSASDQKHRLLFVGRISPEKGVHVLLEAFQKVLIQNFQVELDLVGPWGEMPPEYLVLLGQEDHVTDLKRFYPKARGKQSQTNYSDHIKSLVVRPEFSSKIKFHGHLPHDQLSQFFQNSDVFINSSLSDAFPVPIPEAMNHSLPVIASRVGGIPEAVIDGKTGLLVEPGNVDDLANSITCLLRDGKLRKKMGQAAYERYMSNFSYTIIANHLLDQYRNLL